MGSKVKNFPNLRYHPYHQMAKAMEPVLKSKKEYLLVQFLYSSEVYTTIVNRSEPIRLFNSYVLFLNIRKPQENGRSGEKGYYTFTM